MRLSAVDLFKDGKRLVGVAGLEVSQGQVLLRVVLVRLELQLSICGQLRI